MRIQFIVFHSCFDTIFAFVTGNLVLKKHLLLQLYMSLLTSILLYNVVDDWLVHMSDQLITILCTLDCRISVPIRVFI